MQSALKSLVFQGKGAVRRYTVYCILYIYIETLCEASEVSGNFVQLGSCSVGRSSSPNRLKKTDTPTI